MNLNLLKISGSTLALLSAAPAPEPVPRNAEPPPVLYYWHGTPVAGREDEAWTVVIRLENHFQANYLERAPVRVFTPAFGEQSSAHWFIPYADVVRGEEMGEVLSQDEGWRALMAQRAELLRTAENTGTFLFHLGGLPPRKAPKPYRWLQVTHSPLTKMPLAERLARRVVDHLEASYDQIDAHAYTSDMTDRGAIYWMVDFNNLAEWSSFRAELQRDDAYVEMFAEAEGLFFEDRTTDAMLRD